MSKQLTIRKLFRTLRSGDDEVIEFSAGVNVIVGPQNSGKSTWLRMLDYLMGDTESAAEKFDELIVRRYQAVSAEFQFGDEIAVISRRWNEDGRRAQMSLNGEQFTIGAVQPFFLERLNIPLLRYPQGNVLASDRTWPTLGWRSLLRHIYRRQDFWSDLVPQQPESEQHACILQFLGIAEHLFGDELANLVDKQKELTRLEARKDFYSEMMQQLAPEILGEGSLSVAVTIDSIEAAQAKIEDEIAELVRQRGACLADLRDQSEFPGGDLRRLMDRRTNALYAREELIGNLERVRSRLRDLADYRATLSGELDRLERAATAAEIFEGIRVTHCPACDQPVDNRPRISGHCFLCGQSTPDDNGDAEAAARRIQFERDQIKAEIVEAEELLEAASNEQARVCEELAGVDGELRQLEAALRPFQVTASSIVPEELSLIDQRIGSLNARREAVNRLRGPLEARNKLTADIDNLADAIRRLQGAVAAQEEKIELEAASDRLTDGFNTYLNALRDRDPRTWTATNRVRVRVSERRTQYFIGDGSAKSRLGGTLTIYFLFAYHYALLQLSRYSDCHYPGLTVLDFFADIARTDSIGERLGLVLEPFIELGQQAEIPLQLIAAARDFPRRTDIQFIELNQTWV